MEAEVSHLERLKESVMSGDTEIQNLVDNCSIDDPDLALLFPATQEASSEGFEKKIQELDNSLDCPVVGVSVGGFATQDTNGLTTNGLAVVFLKDIDFEIERVEDAWNIDREEAQNLMRNENTTLTFETGSWSPGDQKRSVWSTISSYSSKILAKDLLGKNRYVLPRIRKRLRNMEVGYSPVFTARLELLRQGEKILNFNSGDMGDFQEGYEIFGSEVTEGLSATFVKTEEDFTYGEAGNTELAFENDRVLETFEEIQHSGYVLYGFNGNSISDLAEEYPLQRQIGKGNFMYYFIIVMSDVEFSVPINADLDIIVSDMRLEDVQKAHLVRAPSFSEYKNQFTDMLQDMSGVPHISICPPQLVSFRSNINQIIEETQDQLDEFILTTDNAQREYDKMDYNFAKSYRTQAVSGLSARRHLLIYKFPESELSYGTYKILPAVRQRNRQALRRREKTVRRLLPGQKQSTGNTG